MCASRRRAGQHAGAAPPVKAGAATRSVQLPERLAQLLDFRKARIDFGRG
jgi:hypothetical protein